MDKYTKKLSKADCKKFAKEVAKKLVASDFKNKRVDDPTKITDKQEKKVKQYVKEYFEKAVKKKEDIDRHRKEKEARKAKLNGSAHGPKPNVNCNAKTMEMDTKGESDVEPDEDPEMDMTPSSPTPCTPSVVESSFEPSDLKRKRERGEETPGDDSESSKRRKEEDLSPPPPPPPPPAESMPEGEEQDEMEDVEGMEEMVIHETKEERDMREQEEELMRENEEAMMMDMDGSLKSAEEHLYQNGHTQSNGNGNGYGIKSGPEPHLQPTGATIDPPSRKVRMD
jgi:histone-lysine N-methyltransferase SETD2